MSHQTGAHFALLTSTAKPPFSLQFRGHFTGPAAPKRVKLRILTPASYPKVPFMCRSFLAPLYQNLISEVASCTKLSPSSKYSSPLALPSLSGETRISKSSFRRVVVVLAPLIRRGRIDPPRMCTGISVNEMLVRVVCDPLPNIGCKVWKL